MSFDYIFFCKWQYNFIAEEGKEKTREEILERIYLLFITLENVIFFFHIYIIMYSNTTLENIISINDIQPLYQYCQHESTPLVLFPSVQYPY